MNTTKYRTDCAKLQVLLRNLRDEAGLRQSDVAAILDVPQSYVSKYESGERRLDIVELREVCDALGVSLKTFIQLLEAKLETKRSIPK